MLEISTKNKYLQYFLYLLIIAPIVLYLRYVYVYALNIPRQDDYDAILDFLVQFSKANFSDQITLLFAQHNEHRIFSSRLVYAIYYKMTGTINFRHLIFINAGMLCSLFAVLAFFIRQALPQRWALCVWVLSLSIFGLNNFENMDFAMAGMQNYGVILLAAASIFFYSRPAKGYLVPAVLLQVLCVFASGNGNIGAFFVVLYNLLSKDRLRIGVSLSALILFAPLYYYHYHQPPTGFFTLSPSKFVPFFLHVAGAHFSFEHGNAAGVLLMTVLLISLPVGKRMKIKQEHLPLVMIAGFVLASMAVMSVFRGNMPIGTAYSSRYFIYPDLLTALAFVFLTIKYGHEKMGWLINPVVIILMLLCYNWNTRDGVNGFKSFHNELKSMAYHYPDEVRAKQIADEACARGIYCIEKHRGD